jgi:hypothetical protein
MKDGLVDPDVSQRNGERRRLDELRPIPDDGENTHRGLHYAPRWGR